MLIFRFICAIMVAWAMNWVMARPEAQFLVDNTREMVVIAPLAGGIVGFFNLASRQGWGLIVSVANGVWTGILSIVCGAVIYLCYRMSDPMMHGLIPTFEAFLRILADEADPLLKQAVNVRLILITVGATTVTGIISEFLHWSLVRLRRYRDDDETSTV